MRTPIPWLLATWLTTLTASSAWAQAGRYVPRSRPLRGGGGGGGHGHLHMPDSLLHRIWDSGVLWVILAMAGLIVLGVVVWHVGQVLGRCWWTLLRGPESARKGKPMALQPASQSPKADLIRSPAEVATKAQQTTQLMEILAYHDHLFDPSSLREWAAETFCLVQKCWQERNYDPLQGLLMPGILAKHQGLLQSMRQDHEINRMEGLRIERLEFVHLYCPYNTDQQEFTALITFEASAYFVDDRTNAHTRGPRESRWFQEFWVFRRQGDSWRLQAIERSHESDRLESENRVTEITGEQLHSAQHSIAL